MRIAILNSFYWPKEPGGAERSVRILAESLQNSGHQVHIICLGRNRESTELNGVCIEVMPIRNAYLPINNESQNGLNKLRWHARDSYNNSAAHDVRELLRQIRPDLLHTNNLSGFSVAIWAHARDLKIPVVHTTRDFYLMCPKTTMMKRNESCTKSCATCLPFVLPRRLASSHIDHVVGISKFILNLHKSNGYFNDVAASVIYNPFEAPPTPFRAVGKEVKIGFIGRLVPEKGVELLLDAFRQLTQQGLKAQLLIAGEGRNEYVESLKARTSDLHVIFLGKVTPDEFFPRLDLTVAPSIWSEPLGRIVIESISYGKPVVATPVGGMPELLAPGTGLVAADLGTESLVQAIQRALEMLRHDALSIYSASIAHSKNFELSAILNSYMTVYNSVAAVAK